MNNLQFLDLTGLKRREIVEIHAWLFDGDINFNLPWRNGPKSALSNDRRRSYVHKNCNGTFIENSSQLKYPSHIAYYGINNNSFQLQKMNAYVPTQHPTVYSNFQASPPMIDNGNRENGVQLIYQTNDMHSFTLSSPDYCTSSVDNQSMQEMHQIQNVEPGSKECGKNMTSDVPETTKLNEYVEKPEIQQSVMNYNAVPFKPKNGKVITKEQPLISVSKSDSDESFNTSKKNDIESENTKPISVWAKKPGISLFKKDTHITNGKLQMQEKNPEVKCAQIVNFISPSTYRLGEFLVNYNLNVKGVILKPRGLLNKSNYCYINSILQSLIACPPLIGLLKEMSQHVTIDNKESIPMIENMCKFINQFEMSEEPQNKLKRKNKKKRQPVISWGDPIEAYSFHTLLNGTRSDSFQIEDRQEDAEEFLGVLLNRLNDEMKKIMELINKEKKEEIIEDSDEWKVMGPKNKGNITRKVQLEKTPIRDIFSGSLCSRIHKAGEETTVNIQPFFTLQLNVKTNNTIYEALEGLTAKNNLEGLTSSLTKQTVEAWQQVMIEQLPLVLILHLKCFDYKLDGCTKIMKTLEFPVDINIDSKILSGKNNCYSNRQYRLFAVVYHEGKGANNGHYVADTFHAHYKTWLRFDDAKLKEVPLESVLSPEGDQVPYLLFYRRCD